jgi:hypothetical protein
MQRVGGGGEDVRRTSRGLEDQTNGLTVADVQEGGDIGKNEENWNEVDDTRNSRRGNREYHGLWHLSLRHLYLFTHGSNHSISSKGISGLQQSDKECPSRWPATGRGVKMRKHKFPTSLGRGHDEDRDHDNNYRGASPVLGIG